MDLLDLLVELLDERFEEIELLLHEAHGHVFVSLTDGADDLIHPLHVARSRRFRGGNEIVRYAGQGRDDDDRFELLPLGDDIDGVRHALRVADRSAAKLDDDHLATSGRQANAE